jgi:hypothetical protein
MDNRQYEPEQPEPAVDQDINLLVEWEEDASDLPLPEKAGEDDILTLTSGETGEPDDGALSGLTISHEETDAGVRISQAERSSGESGSLGFDLQEVSTEPPGEDEFFWSEDLDRAIDEALEQMNGISAPVVYSRLKRIAGLFDAGAITEERAAFLLDEVDKYLEAQITKRTSLPPTTHEGMETARTLLLTALQSFHESSKHLRDYTKTKNPDTRTLSENLTEHGITTALQGVEQILAAEPGEYEE